MHAAIRRQTVAFTGNRFALNWVIDGALQSEVCQVDVVPGTLQTRKIPVKVKTFKNASKRH